MIPLLVTLKTVSNLVHHLPTFPMTGYALYAVSAKTSLHLLNNSIFFFTELRPALFRLSGEQTYEGHTVVHQQVVAFVVQVGGVVYAFVLKVDCTELRIVDLYA